MKKEINIDSEVRFIDPNSSYGTGTVSKLFNGTLGTPMAQVNFGSRTVVCRVEDIEIPYDKPTLTEEAEENTPSLEDMLSFIQRQKEKAESDYEDAGCLYLFLPEIKAIEELINTAINHAND